MAGGTRTFVALELPAAHREALAAHLEVCARLAPGFRWSHPDDLHLTLRFLGPLDGEALGRVREELARLRLASFRIGLDGIGTFGTRRKPRAVWLGLGEGQEASRALARAVDVSCLEAGMAPDPRPFRAHVTLARPRTEGEPLPVLPAPPLLPAWTAEEFVLFESRLGQRPRYVPLSRYELSAEPDRG